MNILVGVSGGVDSAVALHMLKSQGHSVIGAMMKIYNGDIKTIANSCYGTDKQQEIIDARNICNNVGCDFHLIDLADDYDKIVFSQFKNLYLKGLTPNPCVICNKFIKFGLFPATVKKLNIKFDKFATGHYAKNVFNENTGRYELSKGKNPKKDQTYFLYKLTQDELKNIIFPLGDFDKSEVRDYAFKNNILSASKQDSQDFYKGDYSDLFNIDPIQGDIVDVFGNILGHHSGICNYTIGQRKGLKIAYSEPLYVVDIDAENNRVIVGTKNATYKNGLIADDVNWISISNPVEPFEATAKIRSSANPVNVVVYPLGDEIKVEFIDKISAVAPGQAVVLYNNDTVLGGGTIKTSF